MPLVVRHLESVTVLAFAAPDAARLVLVLQATPVRRRRRLERRRKRCPGARVRFAVRVDADEVHLLVRRVARDYVPNEEVCAAVLGRQVEVNHLVLYTGAPAKLVADGHPRCGTGTGQLDFHVAEGARLRARHGGEQEQGGEHRYDHRGVAGADVAEAISQGRSSLYRCNRGISFFKEPTVLGMHKKSWREWRGGTLQNYCTT